MIVVLTFFVNINNTPESNPLFPLTEEDSHVDSTDEFNTETSIKQKIGGDTNNSSLTSQAGFKTYLVDASKTLTSYLKERLRSSKLPFYILHHSLKIHL